MLSQSVICLHKVHRSSEREAVSLLPCNQQRDSFIDFHKPPLISHHKAYLTNQQRQVIKLDDSSLLGMRCNTFSNRTGQLFIHICTNAPLYSHEIADLLSNDRFVCISCLGLVDEWESEHFVSYS